MIPVRSAVDVTRCTVFADASVPAAPIVVPAPDAGFDKSASVRVQRLFPFASAESIAPASELS